MLDHCTCAGNGFFLCIYGFLIFYINLTRDNSVKIYKCISTQFIIRLKVCLWYTPEQNPHRNKKEEKEKQDTV